MTAGRGDGSWISGLVPSGHFLFLLHVSVQGTEWIWELVHGRLFAGLHRKPLKNFPSICFVVCEGSLCFGGNFSNICILETATEYWLRSEWMQNCEARLSTSSLKGIPSSPTCVQGFTALSSLLSLPVLLWAWSPNLPLLKVFYYHAINSSTCEVNVH